MSKKVPQEQYEKTFSYKFKQWLDGTKDPFLDTVEMKRQKPFCEEAGKAERRKQDRERIVRRVYDLEKNAELRIFQRIYRVLAVAFCVFLVVMLLLAVSWLL